jgi:hypothetical protein
MRSGIGAAIDRRLEGLIVSWVRRQWPLLRLVPARCMRPAIGPTAIRLRRSLSLGVVALSLAGGIALALLIFVA